MPVSKHSALPSVQPTPTQPLTFSLHVGSDLESAATAREVFIAAVSTWQLPFSSDRLQDLRLCAGELIANAVIHTQQPSSLRSAWNGSVVRVELTDTSTQPPCCTDPADTSRSGRGLNLIQALANDWGFDSEAGGKVIWFECAPEAPPLTALDDGTLIAAFEAAS